MSVPALRFPEFEGKDRRVRELSEVAMPKGLQTGPFGSQLKAEEYVDGLSGTPVVMPRDIANGLITETQVARIDEAKTQEMKRHKLEAGDVVFPRRGELGRIAIVLEHQSGWICGTGCLRFRPDLKKVSPTYLGFSMQRGRAVYWLESNAVGQTMLNLNTEILGGMPISLPSLPEQKKIAAFLGVVDAKIAALRDRQKGLERYKRGLMQALFSQRLRFTKPDGTAFPDWEEKRLGEVATRSTAKNTKLEYMRVLTNSAVRGVIDQGDYFDKDIANAENLAGYYVLKKGDFVYNPRISASAPVGPVKRNDLGDGVMSPLYTVFRFREKDTEFFNVFFETTVWHKYMKAVANYGARHDRMAITSSDLMNMPLPFPCPDEQAKIAKSLSAMDAKIAAVTVQLDRMQDFKKGLLQQMFV